MTPEELARPNVFTIGLEAVAGHLGLTVAGWEQGSRPLTSGSPVKSKVLGRVIEAGDVIGLGTWSRMGTEQGIALSGEMQLKVFEEGDVETSRWIIRGVPTLHVETPHLPGLIATCTSIINRIPDIIACEPGFVTIERLPKPRYKPRLW
jgi:4-hydroxy-tetrahydrodipicolinate reductase